jgi:hypothetical protein
LESEGDLTKKATKHVISTRVAYVRKLLLKGYSRGEIVQEGSKKWRITERQVDDYLARAQTDLKEEAKRHREEAFAEHLAARRELRKRAQNTGDLRIELDTLKDEAKLLNIYPAEKHIHDVNIWEKIMRGTADGSAIPDDDDDPFA